MHSHEHHHHGNGPEDMGRMYTLGILLNIAFVAVEFAVGLFYNSMGLLADAGHNLSDVGSLAISMVAFLLAKRHFSKNYTYGFRKVTIHASLVNAIILLVAVGAIIWECLQKLIHPASVEGLPIIITAGIGIVINGLTVLLFIRHKEKDLNIKGAYLHMLADTLVSIGVVVSGVVIMFTGWTLLDPIIGLLIAVVIVISGWGLMKGSLRLSLDGIPEGISMDEIKTHVLENENVSDIHHVHVWPISTTENALTAHIVLKNVCKLDETKLELHQELAEHGITHSTLEFELSNAKCLNAQC